MTDERNEDDRPPMEVVDGRMVLRVPDKLAKRLRELDDHGTPAPEPIINKAKWPPGPWHDEPDRVEWRDPTTGYPCLITRHEWFGNLCGYVAVPEGHPLFGKQFRELRDIYAHGGVTYSEPCHGRICHARAPGEPDVFWFGFDCAHSRDYTPGMGADVPAHFAPLLASLNAATTYRDLAYVTDQCTALAAQLAAQDGRMD